MISIISFGYLHGDAPQADIVEDVRHQLRDPHVDPALRQMNGFDAEVQEKVMGTTGAWALVDRLVGAAKRRVDGGQEDVTVAIGCQGGRHRSVVLVEHLSEELVDYGYTTYVEHRDIHRPVVER